MPKLRCEHNDPGVGAEVEEAFWLLHDERGEAHYEHGQWWVLAEDGDTYSVNDAEGPPDQVCSGFSFERLS